jgi:hypothetical protein
VVAIGWINGRQRKMEDTMEEKCAEEEDPSHPLSGARGRSASLEYVSLTSSINSPFSSLKTIYDKFSINIPLNESHSSSSSSSSSLYIPLRPTDSNSLKKCVYMYEDKYTFSRILPLGSYIFNSHFECGNLHSAHFLQLQGNYPGRSSHLFYDLYMHEDINSLTGTAQWFYFSVTGMKAKQTVKTQSSMSSVSWHDISCSSVR